MCIDIFSTVIPKLIQSLSKVNLEYNEFICAALILYLKCFYVLKVQCKYDILKSFSHILPFISKLTSDILLWTASKFSNSIFSSKSHPLKLIIF